MTLAYIVAATCLGGLLSVLLAAQLTLSAAASSFIYVAVADLLPQLQRRLSLGETAVQLGWLCSGLTVVLIATGSLPH